MKYGERLKAAREFAGLSQGRLAEKAGTAQENVSKLERGDATGSEFTVQYALACGISPEWLATGKGDMTDGIVVYDKRIKTVVQLMQQMPDYAIDNSVKSVAAIKELDEQARSSVSKR